MEAHPEQAAEERGRNAKVSQFGYGKLPSSHFMENAGSERGLLKVSHPFWFSPVLKLVCKRCA